MHLVHNSWFFFSFCFFVPRVLDFCLRNTQFSYFRVVSVCLPVRVSTKCFPPFKLPWLPSNSTERFKFPDFTEIVRSAEVFFCFFNALCTIYYNVTTRMDYRYFFIFSHCEFHDISFANCTYKREFRISTRAYGI